jgi:hypothetical protein
LINWCSTPSRIDLWLLSALSAGLATLLFDLLSTAEAEVRSNVFDIQLLAGRLQLSLEWLEASQRLPSSCPVGFFGASTGN